MRSNKKIGDVFSVAIDNERKIYFQYIVNDLTQLNSDVIRVFFKRYPNIASPDLSEIVSDEVVFFAHCITKLGIKLGYWEKVGNISNVGKLDNVLFRSSGDVGNLQLKVSQNWWIWNVNQEQKWVGKLEGGNRTAEIGRVIPPDSIVHRIRTGIYYFVYPEYE
jgi:hypothetical protein